PVPYHSCRYAPGLFPSLIWEDRNFRRPGALELKPEFYAIVIVDHAAFLMHAVHNSLNNRQTDTAASVLSGPGFIHFIKFDPDLVQIFLRDRIPCIKYGHPYQISFLKDLYLDFFIIIHMV